MQERVADNEKELYSAFIATLQTQIAELKQERDDYKRIVLGRVSPVVPPVSVEREEPIRKGRMSFKEAAERVREFERKRSEEPAIINDIEENINESISGEKAEGEGRSV